MLQINMHGRPTESEGGVGGKECDFRTHGPMGKAISKWLPYQGLIPGFFYRSGMGE